MTSICYGIAIICRHYWTSCVRFKLQQVKEVKNTLQYSRPTRLGHRTFLITDPSLTEGIFYLAIQLFLSCQCFQHGPQMIRNSMHWSTPLEADNFSGVEYHQYKSVTQFVLVKRKPFVLYFMNSRYKWF